MNVWNSSTIVTRVKTINYTNWGSEEALYFINDKHCNVGTLVIRGIIMIMKNHILLKTILVAWIQRNVDLSDIDFFIYSLQFLVTEFLSQCDQKYKVSAYFKSLYIL